ncbi:MAG TPA: PIG-L deacetylase family protein [Chryseolinea sp.]|nr:PIG-L deacetylase family protein [Chryseolinea sp.]
MKKTNNTRRHFLKEITVGASILPLTLPGIDSVAQAAKKKIVCVGGHPDDPESGCGGTLAKLAKQGHDVTIIYLTTGEAGITGKTHAEAATTRKGEAIAACKVLNAKPVFAGQIDGDTIVNTEWIKKIGELINVEKPDIVFTHWPIDSHKDHQAASMLTIQAWMNSGKGFQLFFFEVLTGIQTAVFNPTDYVDIETTQDQKRKSVFCHKSQDPAGIYSAGHEDMENSRGREIGVKAAEGFVRANGKTGFI